MTKKLCDLSKDELRKLAEGYLDSLNDTTKNMMGINQIGLKIYNDMKTLQIKFKNNVLDLETSRKKLNEIKINICLFTSYYKDRLTDFLKLLYELRRSGQSFFSEIIENEEMHKQVAETTGILKKKENSEEYLYSLLHLQQDISGVIQYDFIKSLKKSPNSDKYDFANLFSVEKKIPCGKGFVSQTIAMRNAIAHVKYSIIPKMILSN